MIGVPVAGTFYRMHSPKWAFKPTSGAGSAKHGGRFNRPGVEGLYLAAETQTAIEEYRQLSSQLPPGLLVSYEVNLTQVADFSKGFDPNQWPPLWEDFSCDWRALALNKIEPPTWVMGDSVLAAGWKGILFPSDKNKGGTNLLVFTSALGAGDVLSANDPKGDLPKNQDSWA